MTADGEVTEYSYDAANRLLTAGDTTFSYDANGNMVEKTDENGTVYYEYTSDNKLKGVYYPDETSVEFTYDAFRRKISRIQSYYDLKDLEDQANGNDKSNGKGNENSSNNGKGNGKPDNPGINGKSNAITRGNGEKVGLIKQMDGLLQTETTNYLYDGMRVLSEYTEKGDPLAEYYTANGQVLAKQMFGFHGRKEEGYEGNIRTRGGLMYYQNDALGNVMDITDHIGDTVMKYRYDAFGNLFTQMAAPYNTVGFTGKSYDAKAGLMDYSARWYSPNYGRFITEDNLMGELDFVQTLNQYAYAGNNPVNYLDDTGNYWWCYSESNGNVYSHAPPCYDDAHRKWIPEPDDDDDDDCDDGGSNDGNDEPSHAELILERLEEFNNQAGSIGNTIQTNIDPIASNYLGFTANDLQEQYGFDEWTFEESLDWTLAGLEKFIQNNSPLLNWTEAIIGRTLVTGEQLTEQESIERFEKGNEVLINGFIGLGTGGRGKINGNKLLNQDAFAKVLNKGASEAITTPYGKAVQSTSKEALELIKYVDNGGQLYRGGTFGRSNVTDGQFWAPENPLNPGYTNKYGVDFSKTDFIIGGKQVPGSPYITRPAPSLGKNAGGGIEIVNNPNSVMLDFFHMP